MPFIYKIRHWIQDNYESEDWRSSYYLTYRIKKWQKLIRKDFRLFLIGISISIEVIEDYVKVPILLIV